ncbi:hypothetical protein Bandiella_00503 [Candidatus Bandiella woodruffii]|uniref:Uncharacterized protein n=1 Tax=Candidatus Bandiella euplotis TaxID=1664265 RepID=A0ABZ0ULL6_9RICK|nr:hypothetical protein Bandiella_00503 [Candidatus Bandiella woodruffii]
MEKYTNNLKVFASYYRCDRAKIFKTGVAIVPKNSR